ncbi:transposase family protein [Streptomyces sp. NPDC101455]|uniref:transposase family protein n=1 Tax=Streptomyces sp. NPDC101455 TaxID=3366142 RepID=UPI0037FC4A8D
MIENAVVDGELVVVRARASAKRAACPACGTTSGRVHSRYVRRFADTAVAGRPVVIELQVRRFRCRDRACRQATFAEQVDGLTFRHGRRSTGLQTVLQQVAVMLAGRADSRLANALAVRASWSTLLRLIRRMPEPEVHTPRVLGVDEFARRKAQLRHDTGGHRHAPSHRSTARPGHGDGGRLARRPPRRRGDLP